MAPHRSPMIIGLTLAQWFLSKAILAAPQYF